MPQPLILVLAPLSHDTQKELESAYPCLDGSTPEALESALSNHGHNIRAIVGHGGSRVDDALLARLPALEIIGLSAVGYDAIDLAACGRRGIAVTNTPDVLTDDVADTALALVLMTSRRLLEANRFLHRGGWQTGVFPLASALAGKTAGILGLGRIGKAIAARLLACGMRICYHGRSRQPVEYPFHETLEDLAAASDFLVLACPGGASTKHLVNDRVLAAMRPGAVLINIARGSVVDEQALIRHLQSGRLGGAGLDVFENEPAVPGDLRAHPSAVLLPHVGSATVETRNAMGRLCLANLAAHFEGRSLLTPVPTA
jgi:hydroxypyruvate reductase